jgi:hypothetical protein
VSRPFRPDQPTTARVWDYLGGGKDNFAADREVGDMLVHAIPEITGVVRQGHLFVARAVHHLAAEEGVRQFLDVGCGMPRYPPVHEVAQAVDPTCRIVYVDHDPIVAIHVRGLMTGTREGATVYLDGDLRKPDTIVGSSILRHTLDLTRPVGLLLSAVLHELADEDRPYEAVRQLVQAMPVGSFVVLSHLTADTLDVPLRPHMAEIERMLGPFELRGRGEVAGFLAGLDLLPPGLVPVEAWGPAVDPVGVGTPFETPVYAAVARR